MLLTAAAVAAAIVFSGCYLATGGASNVTSTSATLQAVGQTGDSPGYYHFEYARQSGDLGGPGGSRTPERGPIPPHTPASSAVTFGEAVAALSAGRVYVYRVCGRQGSMTSDVCFGQNSFFTTPSSVQDYVTGNFEPGSQGQSAAMVSAAASSSGADADGLLNEVPQKGQSFNGRVTCLIVNGNHATIGAVGTFDPDSYDQNPGYAAAKVVTVVDNPTGDIWTDVSLTPGNTPPSCANGTFNGTVVGPGSFTVHDAP